MKTRVAVVLGIGVAAMLVLVMGIFAGTPEGATYVGSSKCKKCHIKQYKSWQKTAHATNFEILTMMGQDQNPECVKCHSTGFGEPGGFVDTATTPKLTNTGCESCHGPGSAHIDNKKKDKEYARSTIQGSPGGPCVKCHNPHVTRKEESSKEALPVLKKKLEELQKLIAALEAE